MNITKVHSRRTTRAGLKGLAAAGVVALALTGCGDDKKDSSGGGGFPFGTKSADSGNDGGDSTAAGDGTGEDVQMSPLHGDWKESPGQSEQVQSKLSSQGFECTKREDGEADVRVCSKGFVIKAADQYDSDHVLVSNLRYVSDAKGTVLLAVMDSSDRQDDPTKKIMAEALLSPADAAVFLADGKNLTWGSVADFTGGDGTILRVKGWQQSTEYKATFKPLSMTKEKALPALQSAQLTCKFSSNDLSNTSKQGLSCSDPSFKPSDEDGSMAGGSAGAELSDDGEGITSIVIDGSHSKKPSENIRGVQTIMPKVKSALNDPGISAAVDWATKHLDGTPHSAYVGQWRVDIVVVPEGGIASWPYVKVGIGREQDDLGFKKPTYGSGSDYDTSPSSSPTY
ncbi:hypothetical protein [Luteipulveratus mongoliensis]|uniref:Uncharacterized protein n=1 Tax=Luteipulveratus mongoliensis TaxID=571913 RepID=A0A0K1JEY6_9MICO|nr:hypothetical protein [Luteipulveratus mongoliensis]AKU15165.1 hypothetical protein VV02_03645 [Luteipulveratus mongoliensis]